jgi:hypothetical protein
MNYVLAHLIGDYIFQNDWMSQNKKKSDLHCSVHVVCYMVPFVLCGFAWWQFLLIALQHYAIDRTNFVVWFMKVKGQNIFATGPCFPWSQIVVDNILHVLWIAFVAWIPDAMWLYWEVLV